MLAKPVSNCLVVRKIGLSRFANCLRKGERRVKRLKSIVMHACACCSTYSAWAAEPRRMNEPKHFESLVQFFCTFLSVTTVVLVVVRTGSNESNVSNCPRERKIKRKCTTRQPDGRYVYLACLDVFNFNPLRFFGIHLSVPSVRVDKFNWTVHLRTSLPPFIVRLSVAKKVACKSLLVSSLASRCRRVFDQIFFFFLFQEEKEVDSFWSIN